MADANRRNRGGMNQRDIKNAASIIIGKGGERIQRLRHECNARLSIPDNHGPERVFILESTMDNCVKIWRDCLPELKEFMFPSNPDNRRSSGSFRDDGPDMDLRFLVHDSQVGAIIGKGGVNVKNLRLQFQLNVIKVYPVTAPFSSDRLVQMVGKFEKVFECFRVIYETLEGQVIKGLVENYNSANFDENLTQGYGGWSNQSGMDNVRKPGPALLGGPTGNDRNAPPTGRFNMVNNSNNGINNNNNNNINNNNRPSNEQFFPKPEMTRNNSLPPKPMNRFDTFNNDTAGGFEMDGDNFQMPFNKVSPMSAEQQQMQQQHGFPGGMRKRPMNPMGNNIGGNNNMNMDMEPDSVKRGRMGMNNPPNVFDARNDKVPNPYDNRNEKPNFFDNRNDNMNNSMNSMSNNNVKPPPNIRGENMGIMNNNNNSSNNSNNNNMSMSMNMNMSMNNSSSNNNAMNAMPPNGNPPSSSGEKIEVTVPTTLIHAVQGLGGEVLTNIVNDSGADIVIGASDEHDLDTILLLTGTKDQIDGAQYLLQICIKKSVLNL